MGKIKLKEKKVDRRDLEISAPILDPEIIEAIHSPQNVELRHGGFKVLLGEQPANTDHQLVGEPVTPSYEVNHLPSYIGISCAVSGYSNYYNPRDEPQLGTRPLDDSTNTTRSENNISRASAGRLASTPTPNQSRLARTGSPRPATPIVSHFRLDKSKFGSIEQERRELVGLMAASLSEKQLNHHRRHDQAGDTPIPPTESDRHHGAYVGARYSPMPDPSDPTPKHIPLLGIDDELDPEQAAQEVEAENKVVRRVASLYGEDFAAGWQEEVKSKTSSQPQEQQQQQQPPQQPEGESVRL